MLSPLKSPTLRNYHILYHHLAQDCTRYETHVSVAQLSIVQPAKAVQVMCCKKRALVTPYIAGHCDHHELQDAADIQQKIVRSQAM